MQIKVIFNILLGLLLLVVLTQDLFAVEWVFVTEMQGRKHYIDKESISDDSGFRWSYYKSEYPVEQAGNDFAAKETYNYTSAVSYMAFNCTNKTLTPLSTNYLNSSGIVVHRIRYTNEKAIIEGEKTWELDNNQATFRSYVIDYVCNKKI